MAGNGQPPGDVPSGGRLLGDKQIVIADLRFVPGLNLSVVYQVGHVELSEPCLQVVDLSTGNAMATPVDARWMRLFAGKLTAAADNLERVEGVGSRHLTPIDGG